MRLSGLGIIFVYLTLEFTLDLFHLWHSPIIYRPWRPTQGWLSLSSDTPQDTRCTYRCSLSLLISVTSASDVNLVFASWRHSPVLERYKTRKSPTVVSFDSSCFLQICSSFPTLSVPRWGDRKGWKMPACALQLALCKWLQLPTCAKRRQCSQCPTLSH